VADALAGGDPAFETRHRQRLRHGLHAVGRVALLVPTVVGSTKANWFPQTIYNWFNDALDWNTGAAYSMIFLLVCIFFVILMMRVFRVKLSDIAKWAGTA
jgi:ABC-type spermidine/putrescine transport system permease subunit I